MMPPAVAPDSLSLRRLSHGTRGEAEAPSRPLVTDSQAEAMRITNPHQYGTMSQASYCSVDVVTHFRPASGNMLQDNLSHDLSRWLGPDPTEPTT